MELSPRLYECMKSLASKLSDDFMHSYNHPRTEGIILSEAINLKNLATQIIYQNIYISFVSVSR